MKRTIPVTALIMFALASCQDITRPGTATVQVVTTKEVFDREPSSGAAISFSVTNQGTRTVYIARCADEILSAADRSENGIWVEYSAGLCLAVLDRSPIPLGPGETLESARWLSEPGEYRLRIGVSPDPAGTPDWSATSNDFSVVG